MNIKLIVTIEKSVIEKAKKYARNRERSLSDLIENYLNAITTNESIVNELSPTLKSLKGSFKISKKFSYKKELTFALSQKHLKHADF